MFRVACCDRVEDDVPIGDLGPVGALGVAFDPSPHVVADLDAVEVIRLTAPGPEIE